MSPSLIVPTFAMKNFLNDQMNLDIMTYLAKGLSLRQIGQKIGKKHSYVQTKRDFLSGNGIMTFGRWNVDVQALGMAKTAEFYDYREEIKDRVLGDKHSNFYLSYLSLVMKGEMKYFAMYTFPEEVKNREGFEITSWYYTFPHFTLPFFNNKNFENKFEEIFDEEDNNNPLPPRGKKIKNPDLIDMYICRYIQRERGDINLKRYTRRMEEEIGDIIDVRYSTVRTRFQRLKKKNIIYPTHPLNFTEISYVTFFAITAYEQVFRFMKTLNKLNIVTGTSFMKKNRNILLIHCPYDKKNAIANILGTLDRGSQMFSITNMYVNRGLPYKYYLRKLNNEPIP